jgi:hypothetical protein
VLRELFLSVQMLIVRRFLFQQGGCLVELDQVPEVKTMPQQQSAYHYGSRVHHWVVRSAKFVENGCIENLPAGFLTDPLMHLLTADLIVYKRVCQHLGYGLHGEFDLRVAHLTLLVVVGAETRREPLGIRLGQGRYVSGD